MSTPHDPDGTFPSFPMTLPDTGQVGELLTAFGTAGCMADLVNAIGWLKDRAGHEALVVADGVGGVAVEWQTPGTDGEDWIESVAIEAVSSVDCIAITHEAFASTNAWCMEAHVQRSSDEATLGSYIVFAEPIQSTALNKTVLRLTDDSGSSLSASTLPWRVKVKMTKAANL